MNHVEYLKFCENHGWPIMVSPDDLNTESDRYKELLTHRTAFIEFQAYLFNLTNEALNDHWLSFKKYIADFGVNERDYAFVDYKLIHDALSYHCCIRNYGGHRDVHIEAEILQSYKLHQQMAESYPEINSEGMITVLKFALSNTQAVKRMSYQQFEEIGLGLYGQSWKSKMAQALEVKRQSINNWEKQSVPKWVYAELNKIIQQRKAELLAAEKLYNAI